MTSGGQTLEELETLMEDAFVLRDSEALAKLFEPGGVLVAGKGQQEARWQRDIGRAAALVVERAGSYVAQPRRIYQNGNIALLVGDGVMNVARRGRDRSWRFVISLLDAGVESGRGREWR